MAPITSAQTEAPSLPLPRKRGREMMQTEHLTVLTGGRADDAPVTRFRPRTVPLPKLPVTYRGSSLRRLLAPRRPTEQALLSVLRETYLAGAGTRTVDALMESVGIATVLPGDGEEWDLRVKAFQERPIADAYPYLMMVETPVLVRAAGGARTYYVVVAVGRTESGHREVVGLGIRPDQSDAAFWRAFFQGLRSRGLEGVQLLTSNPADGLLPALREVYPSARWQRCREGFIRQLVGLLPPVARPAVSASLRAAFAEPDATGALRSLSRTQERFEFGYPELVEALDAPLGSVLTFYGMPPAHRRLISSLKVLAPMLRELRQSCQVVGIFPETRTVLRLCGTFLQEISDEWAARSAPGRRRVTAMAAWEARAAWASARVTTEAVAA